MILKFRYGLKGEDLRGTGSNSQMPMGPQTSLTEALLKEMKRDGVVRQFVEEMRGGLDEIRKVEEKESRDGASEKESKKRNAENDNLIENVDSSDGVSEVELIQSSNTEVDTTKNTSNMRASFLSQLPKVKHAEIIAPHYAKAEGVLRAALKSIAHHLKRVKEARKHRQIQAAASGQEIKDANTNMSGNDKNINSSTSASGGSAAEPAANNDPDADPQESDNNVKPTDDDEFLHQKDPKTKGTTADAAIVRAVERTVFYDFLELAEEESEHMSQKIKDFWDDIPDGRSFRNFLSGSTTHSGTAAHSAHGSDSGTNHNNDGAADDFDDSGDLLRVLFGEETLQKQTLEGERGLGWEFGRCVISASNSYSNHGASNASFGSSADTPAIHPAFRPFTVSHKDSRSNRASGRAPNRMAQQHTDINKEQSNKEQSNKEQSNKEQSNKEQSNKEQSNKEQSNKEQSNKVAFHTSSSLQSSLRKLPSLDVQELMKIFTVLNVEKAAATVTKSREEQQVEDEYLELSHVLGLTFEEDADYGHACDSGYTIVTTIN
jgi:hypothetical protein